MINNNEVLDNEIQQLIEKKNKILAFAGKLPIFASKIIDGKFTGEEKNISFGNQYKTLYLGWNIHRYYFSPERGYTIFDYDKQEDYSLHLFKITINTFTMYKTTENFWLDDYIKDMDLFFYDKLNTTLYATEEQIENVLNKLVDWDLQARKKASLQKLLNKKEELEKELLNINEKINELNN